MASFEPAVSVVFDHEGGFVNDPRDHGGATNWGITQATLKAWRGADVTVEDVRQLTKDEAKQIYHAWYWDSRYEWITNQNVATKLLDASVNVGRHQAIRFLQRALNLSGHPVVVDSFFGPQTLSATNAAVPEEVVLEMCHEMTLFYLGLIRSNPSQEAFRSGWLARAAWPWGDVVADTVA